MKNDKCTWLWISTLVGLVLGLLAVRNGDTDAAVDVMAMSSHRKEGGEIGI